MRATAAGAVAAAVLMACTSGPADPATGWVEFPEEPQVRALHCTVLLAVTLAQMEELAGAGPRAGFIAGRPNTEQVRAAQANSEDALDGAGRSRLAVDSSRLQVALIEVFDRTGDDRLSNPDELAEFNRHIRRCVESYA